MFNVRVYGILIHNENQILVSDEYIKGKYYTKFPGGGLEPGEGTRDCLKREFKEEMNLSVKVSDHIYTTDFYQKSAFNPNDQIISIYYFVEPAEPISFHLTHSKNDFTGDQLKIYQRDFKIETFRFVEFNELSADDLSFPIDKMVLQMLKESDSVFKISK